MANELTIGGVNTGSTVRALVRRDSDEKAWCVAHQAWETYGNTEFAAGNYFTALTEQGTSGYFVGNFPAAITDAGQFNVSYYTVVGSTYTYETTETIDWTGTSVVAGATGLSWITREDYKTTYSVTDASLDDVLDTLIPLVSAALNTYLDKTVKATDISRVYRGNGLGLLNLREFPVNSVTTVTFDYLDTVPTATNGSEFYASGSGRLYFKPSSSQRRFFDSDFIHVAFNAGHSAVPYDLQLVCLRVVHNLVLEADPDVLVQTKSFKDQTVKYFDVIATGVGIDAVSRQILDGHKSLACI